MLKNENGASMKQCGACGSYIGNAAKHCRWCHVGEPIMRMGYIAVYAPDHPLAASDGYVMQHRWLLHEMAVPVTDGDHVHHRNGDKTDNRWSNLEVMSESEHHRHHIAEVGHITNQYGTFPVVRDPEARRERARLTQRRLRARRRQGIAAWGGGC